MNTNLNVLSLAEWNIPSNDRMIIAGPCSAESEEQVMKTALALKDRNVDVLRAGIWKPRTRPNSFEGVGTPGLKWLKAAGKAAGLPVAVEVANPKQIEDALAHGIDILWIGARTTPNPFAVQEIAEALKGVDAQVMVKNPINADLQLWIGAMERLNMAGVKKIVAIHRGFSTYKEELYRNQPLWRIPIELKRMVPGIPLVCDPSHICGKRELIFGVAQKALDLLFDGLMIEVHINPDEALSDARQQLTPDAFFELMDNLKFRAATSNSLDVMAQLKSLRDGIDHYDEQLIEILAKRMENARKISVHKMKNNIAIFQPGRWDEVVKSRIEKGARSNLSEEFIFQLFQYIHEESIRQQEQVLND